MNKWELIKLKFLETILIKLFFDHLFFSHPVALYQLNNHLTTPSVLMTHYSHYLFSFYIIFYFAMSFLKFRKKKFHKFSTSSRRKWKEEDNVMSLCLLYITHHSSINLSNINNCTTLVVITIIRKKWSKFWVDHVVKSINIYHTYSNFTV